MCESQTLSNRFDYRLNEKYNDQTIFFLEQKNILKTDVFGFNSARFDLPLLIAPLVLELKDSLAGKITIMKKMGSYISISNDKFIFKDCLKFTSPCNYSKFLSMWQIQEIKLIWPYSLFHFRVRKN